jgi:death-on-curing protein
MEVIFLGLDEIIAIHENQLQLHGGISGIRNLDLLKSAAAMPAAAISSDYLHSDIYEMAAAYLFHITKNHPFLDGNKRAGATAAVVFLLMNGVELVADEDSFERLVWAVAEEKTA